MLSKENPSKVIESMQDWQFEGIVFLGCGWWFGKISGPCRENVNPDDILLALRKNILT